jgi:hypothetical protein
MGMRGRYRRNSENLPRTLSEPLRNQLKYLKRKTDQPPEVLALLDQIKRLSLQVPNLKQCLTVPPWCLSSEDSESCDLPVPKRRSLLVKTKAPSFALDASLASTAESVLKRPAVLWRPSLRECESVLFKSKSMSLEEENAARCAI